MVDGSLQTTKEIRAQQSKRINSTALLTTLKIDFCDPQTTQHKTKKEEVIAHKIDSQVDLFNRLAYNHNVVLVHCAMGVSRSASCVIMFIMKKFKQRF